MPWRVTIAKTLEDFWGVDDLVADMPADATPSERNRSIVELLMEDTSALLDGVEWTVTQEEETADGRK